MKSQYNNEEITLSRALTGRKIWLSRHVVQNKEENRGGGRIWRIRDTEKGKGEVLRRR